MFNISIRHSNLPKIFWPRRTTRQKHLVDNEDLQRLHSNVWLFVSNTRKNLSQISYRFIDNMVNDKRCSGIKLFQSVERPIKGKDN